MKKILVLLIALTLILGIVPISFAAEEPTVVYVGKEIKDHNVLLDRALQKISDVKDDFITPSGKFVNKKTGQKKDVYFHSTTQLLKIENYSNKSTKSYFATTTFADVPLDVETSLLHFLASSKFKKYGSLTDNEYDPKSFYGVRAYSTIYWTNTTNSDGARLYDLTRATGGWSIYDSAFSLSNKKVVLGASGTEALGQDVTYNPTTTTFDYYTPSSWVGISVGWVGCTQTTTVNRGSSNWEFVFTNNCLGSGPWIP